MKTLKYIILGIIQGLTEPLPISSSAHMIFINHYLGITTLDLTTEVFINFASTLAIFIFFFKDIKTLIINTFTNNNTHELNRSYSIKLIIASIPTIIIGFLFKDIIDKYYLSFLSSSIMLLFTGVFLLYSIYLLHTVKTPRSNEISTTKALTIGIFQSIALLPGLSRSGLTLTAGITNNNTIKSTLKFSFFMYLIASFGAFILELSSINFYLIDWFNLMISFIFSFITACISIRWFYNKLNIKSLSFFMFYSFILGSINLLSHFI